MALTAVVVFLATVFGTTYAVQPAYGIGFPAGVYLWIPVLGNVCSVILIPFVGRLSDKIGRRPPVLVGALSAGLFSFGFLYAISIHNLWLSLIFSALMWGIAYQGFNGVFPSLFPELSKVRKFIASSHAGGSFIDERSLDRACIAPQIDSSITGILTFSVSQCIGLTRVRGH
jgi:MFS family permease